MNLSDIKYPTLLLNKDICISNITRMKKKCDAEGIIFRPHFKTHQSLEVGRWFREYGVRKITVSSVTMAKYFANDGWDDILIAFPFNPREIIEIEELSERIDLTLTVPGYESATSLAALIKNRVSVMIKVDTGYGRSGTRWDNIDQIKMIYEVILSNPALRFKGLLTHAGNTYKATGKEAIRRIFNESSERLISIKDELAADKNILSVGDTPSASVVDSFGGIDELRPGNFVFFDLMQHIIGSCALNDIATVVACPVVDIQIDKRRFIIYGGGVHLSKESIPVDGKTVFGRIVKITDGRWEIPDEAVYVTSLSQEHGIIECPSQLIENIQIGDLIGVVPVHSCLTADLLGRYRLVGGGYIDHLNNH